MVLSASYRMWSFSVPKLMRMEMESGRLLCWKFFTMPKTTDSKFLLRLICWVTLGLGSLPMARPVAPPPGLREK